MEKTIVSFDWAIKDILRDKSNFDILSGFLSELLGKEVVVLNILESERNKTNPFDKQSKVDLKASIEGDEIVIFEVQVGRQNDFFQRMLFGASTAVTEQLSEGDSYGKINKVYSIGIIYFELGEGTDYIYRGATDFKGVHNNETLVLSEFEEKLMPKRPAGDLFPEYILIYPQRFDEDIRDRFDEWVYTLKKSVVKGEFTAAGIQAAGDKLNVQMMTHDQRIAHNDFIKYRRIKSSEAESMQMEYEYKLKEKDNKLKEKDNKLKEKDNKLKEKDKEIERLRKLLSANKK